VDGLKFLFLREIQKSASEAFGDLVYKVLPYLQHDYSPSTLKIKFPNGSVGILGGYKNEGDIDKYIGLEYDLIVIEERTTISGDRILRLKGSLRSTKNMNDGRRWIPRVYSTANPGGKGHLEFKETYIIPWREGKEESTRFIPGTYRDNPYLNKEYIDYLESLKGDLGKAWRDGDWDIFEGQAFPAWNYDLHVVEPFEIPSHWVRRRGVDWGYNAPYCCLWGAFDPDTGRVIVYRETYHAGLTDRQQANQIAELTRPEELVRISFGDPSMWNKKTIEDTSTSTADEYSRHGVPLTKADNDRLSGKRKVDRMLQLLPDGKPGLQIFRTCSNLIRTFPALPYDDRHVEDVDTDAEDHAYDALRYLLSDVRDKAEKPKPRQEHPLKKVKHI
jgi:phage terminase large subunit